jgi:hypothetical protein
MLQTHLNNNINFESEFLNLSLRLTDILRAEGLKTQAFKNESLPFFSALSTDKKKEVTSLLRSYLEVCEETVASGHSLRNTNAFVWRFFTKTGLIPTSDIMALLNDGEVVEIYDTKNVQLFRNVPFMEVCSYTIEELYCIEWWKLYHRDPKYTQQLFQQVGRLFSGEFTSTYTPDVEEHYLEEIASNDKLKMLYRLNKISPIKLNGEISGYLVIESCKLLPNFT